MGSLRACLIHRGHAAKLNFPECREQYEADEQARNLPQEFEAEKILLTRIKRRGSVATLEFEVKWQGFAQTTWEPLANVQSCQAYLEYQHAEREARETAEAEAAPRQQQLQAAAAGGDAEAQVHRTTEGSLLLIPSVIPAVHAEAQKRAKLVSSTRSKVHIRIPAVNSSSNPCCSPGVLYSIEEQGRVCRAARWERHLERGGELRRGRGTSVLPLLVVAAAAVVVLLLLMLTATEDLRMPRPGTEVVPGCAGEPQRSSRPPV